MKKHVNTAVYIFGVFSIVAAGVWITNIIDLVGKLNISPFIVVIVIVVAAPILMIPVMYVWVCLYVCFDEALEILMGKLAITATRHNHENLLYWLPSKSFRESLLESADVKLATLKKLEDKKFYSAVKNNLQGKKKKALLTELPAKRFCETCEKTGTQLINNGYIGWMEELAALIMSITKCKTCATI